MNGSGIGRAFQQVTSASMALFVFALSVVQLTAGAATAQDFPAEPVLRLETGKHTVRINRITVDRDERFLVTGSHDKTARVWDLESGRLLSVLRVPLAPGNAGRIDAVAISPDGFTIAVGGWMVPERSGVVYLFDRATAQIRARITGDDETVVGHLDFSPDGRFLVAALSQEGVRVYRTSDYTEVARDEDYQGRSYGAAFDTQNRLVTVSFDGHVRLYNASFELIKKAIPAANQRPYSAAFSPDGSRIAVGYNGSTRVDVLSADDLQVLFTANQPGAQGNLSTVAWSRDGAYLYAAGQHNMKGTDRNVVRRWDRAGQGTATDFPVSDTTVMGIATFKSSGLAVGASDPLAAVLNAQGEPVWEHVQSVPNFRGQDGANSIRLSRNGDRVAFGFKYRGGDPALFSLRDAELSRDLPDNPDLTGAVTEADGLRVTGWNHQRNPKVNDEELDLKRYERSRSLAIAPDGRRFLLGTEWSLRFFDQNGEELWQLPAPGTAWAVNIARNGKVAVAGFGDGTLRWFRLEDGEELLALFVDPASERWVAWTPQGYYRASAGAEDLIGWHLNDGPDETPEFFGASRFREQFSRPDVIARVLDTLDVEQALQEADEARGTRTVERDVRALRPPVIRIVAPAAGTKSSDGKLVLTYVTESPAGPVTEVQARVDGRPAEVREHHFGEIGQITLGIPPRNSTVSLIAKNDNGFSEPAKFLVSWEGAADYYKPELYVLAVGISQYHDPGIPDLKFGHRDAEDFVAAIKKQRGGLYKSVTVRLLTDETATQRAVLQGMNWLERQSKQRDVAILFLAGHGITDSKGRYRFLPHDADVADLKLTTVKDSDFKEFLGDIAAKTIMFNDTCHSGSVLKDTRGDSRPNIDQFASELADADSGVIVFSSSTGRQLSQEKTGWQNGAFTEALIEAINEGLADYTSDWLISIAELEVYLAQRVKELTNGGQKPVTSKPEAVEDYKIVRIAERQ